MGKLKKETLIKIAAVFGIFLLFCGILFGVSRFAKNAQQPAEPSDTLPTVTGTVPSTYSDIYEEEDEVPIVFYNGQAYAERENIETILFLGIDKREQEESANLHNNHAQADVLMLFVVDHDTQEYTVLQLNRDTMTEVSEIGTSGDSLGSSVMQLALSHTYGSGREDSCEYTAAAVSHLLFGTDIDHYVALSMDAIGVLNDQVGGVTVTIPVDMTMCDEEMEEGATITLNAEQAEYFVRARMVLADGTNIARMERQRAFLYAWREQAIARLHQDSTFALEFVLALSEYMVSDMTADELASFGENLAGYTNNGIVSTEGTSVEGEEFMEFYVDEDDLRSKIMDIFYYETTVGSDDA